MLRYLIVSFLFATTGYSYGVDSYQYCWTNRFDEKIYSEFAWFDGDRDRHPEKEEGSWHCPPNGTDMQIREWATQLIDESRLPLNNDGTVAVDCNDSDFTRTTTLTVWRDENQNGYSPKDTIAEVLCLYPDGITHPEIDYKTPSSLGYTTNNPSSKPNYDCDDNSPPFGPDSPSYVLSKTSYTDNDGDGFGDLPIIGQTCELKAATIPSDCNDHDPLILGSWFYGSPAKKACDLYKPRVIYAPKDTVNPADKEEDFKITIHEEDLGQTRKFYIYGEVNDQPTSGNNINCTENCPSWTLKRHAPPRFGNDGTVSWSNIKFDGLQPTTPYEGGSFDPKKESSYRVKFLVSSGFGGQYDAAKYLTVKYEPLCPELKTLLGRREIMNDGFVKPKGSSIFNSGIHTSFAPICPSTKEPIKLATLAKYMDVDHFNWWQSISFPGADVRAVAEDKLKVTGSTYEKDEYETLPLWFLDPVPTQKYLFISPKSDEPEQSTFLFTNFERTTNQPFDTLPFYLNENTTDSNGAPIVPEYENQSTEYKLKFYDHPTAPKGWFARHSGSRFNQPNTKFILRVAAVKSGGSFKLWTSKYNWSTNKESLDVDVFGATFTGKATVAPIGYEKFPGENTFEGITDLDLWQTPPLVGKNISEESVVKEFIEGTGFTIQILAEENSVHIPAGLVISQVPGELEEVKNPGTIKVVISKGPAKPCGQIPSGGTTTRTLYKSDKVPHGSTCDSVKEVQNGVCTDGVLVFNGSATFNSCVIEAAPASCTKTVKKICKAGLLGINKCDVAEQVISVKKDTSYKGSQCHEAPSKLSIWNALKFINSYSIKDSKVNVQLGCNARFDFTVKGICPK